MAELLEDIVAAHRARLGDDLVGVYLHGSRATGDHSPLSDVDYLVVAERPLSVAEKRELVEELRELSKRAPAAGVEMSVITRQTLRRFRHPAPFEFHFSRDWLERYDRGQVNLDERRTDPDLASHVVHTRERGRVLCGERIESVFPPIDRRYHLAATLDDASWVMEHPVENPLYTVLNLCRALAVVDGGMTPSKREAAGWALKTLPSELRPLVEEARRRYERGERGDGLGRGELAAFVGYMRNALARSPCEGERPDERRHAASVLAMGLKADAIELRPWRETDATWVYAACQDRELQRWLPDLPRPYTHDDARAFVTGALGLGPYQFAVTERADLVGSIGLRIGKHQTGYVRHWCAREARRRGITTRALRRLCRLGLEDLDLKRLELTTDVENVASQRVAEKVGFQREGVLRSHLDHPEGHRRDSVLFSLLPGELL